MEDFAGQVAVVTGAAGGLGAAITRALAAQGATMCLSGRNLARLVAATPDKTTGKVFHYRADLTVEDDIRKLAIQLQRDVGNIDILVHSAGVISVSSIETGNIGDFDEQYRTNVRAPFLLTKHLLPMIRTGHGQIVFMNSSLGVAARANVSQYAATKHALKAIADGLRDELNGRGIRVLSVFPGRTATSMQATLHKMEGNAYRPERLLQPEDVASIIVAALRLPRSAEVTDINIRPMMKP